MNMEQVKAFLKAVNESEELQEKIHAGGDVVEVAKSVGFEITAEELIQMKSEMENNGALNEEELSVIAGGFSTWLCPQVSTAVVEPYNEWGMVTDSATLKS